VDCKELVHTLAQWHCGPSIALIALAAGALGGCVTQATTSVVVVPTPSGHVGAVVVNPGRNQVVLDTAYASATEGEDGRVTLETSSAEHVDRVFAEAKRALPRRALTYVYFPLGSDALMPEARHTLADLVLGLSKHRGDIVVTGHTDRSGRDAVNVELSVRRAKRVRDFLVDHGVASRRVRHAGRGPSVPLVETADGVAEPRNRRAEIEVR
jgi:outer membrane protein OmpA-like peptidoglycan-associated protein